MVKCSIFSSPWWLDATAGEGNWGLCEVNESGKTVASMPWVIKQRFGLKTLSQPILTQTLGPWLAEPPKGTKYAKRLAREKDLMEALIDQLPDYEVFRQNFAPEITNWLPFYWKGFQQSTRYTYRLTNIGDNPEVIWSGFQENIRREIRKARKLDVVVERCSDVDAFLDVNELTFQRQGMKVPYSRFYVKRLFAACEANKAGAIFLARGQDGRVHAGNLLVWNEHCSYYLMGGGDPELRTSGATSLVMWQAIQFAATVSRVFDFEGSMIEPVERFFRGFGAVQTPYFSISHIRSRRVASAMAFRSMAKSWF